MKDEEVDAGLSRIADPPRDGDCIDDATLLAYVKLSIDPDRRASIEKHLASCADCRLLAEGLALDANPALLASGERAFARKRSLPITAIAGVLALAASVALFVFVPRGPSSDQVPSFRIEGPFGGVQATRDSKEISTRFDPNSTLELIFRPETPAPKTNVTVYLSASSGAFVQNTTGEVERSADGALIYRAPAAAFFANRPGTFAAIFVLSVGPALPASVQSVAALENHPDVVRAFALELTYLVEGGADE